MDEESATESMMRDVEAGIDAIHRWIPLSHEIDEPADRELMKMTRALLVLAMVLPDVPPSERRERGNMMIKDGLEYLAQAAYQLGYRKGQDDGANRGE